MMFDIVGFTKLQIITILLILPWSAFGKADRVGTALGVLTRGTGLLVELELGVLHGEVSK